MRDSIRNVKVRVDIKHHAQEWRCFLHPAEGAKGGHGMTQGRCIARILTQSDLSPMCSLFVTSFGVVRNAKRGMVPKRQRILRRKTKCVFGARNCCGAVSQITV